MGNDVWILDHCRRITKARKVGGTETEVALIVGTTRLLTRPWSEVYATERDAVAARLQANTEQQSLLQREWIRLSQRLSQLAAPAQPEPASFPPSTPK